MAYALALRERMVLNEAIPEVVNFHRTVRDDPGAIAYALSGLCVAGIDRANFERIRDINPSTLTPEVAAARTVFLNKLGYNGLYRVNKSGKFNTPFDDSKAFAPPLCFRPSVVERKCRDHIGSLFPNKEKWHDAAAALAGSKIYCGDFEPIVNAAGAGDVIYADPPYADTYDSYTPEGFPLADHVRLGDALERAYLRGAVVFASNADTELVRNRYQWAEVRDSTERRTINAKASERVPAKCVFIGSPGAFDR